MALHIQIEGLTKRFKDVTALDNVSLTIESGMFGLLGPNGAGKSTLMRILATILDPTEGKVTIGNYQLPRDKEPVRQMLGYLPQEFGLYRRMTGRQFLEYVAVLKGMVDRRERLRRVDELLELVNLKHAAHRRVRGYSGGMKQRLGIAQALLGDPKLLIVDEPAAGLDPEERIRFRNLLSDLGRERVIILSTHIVADISGTCHRLAVLRQGRIAFHGSVHELTRRAKGHVWSVVVRESEYPAFEKNFRVVQTRATDQGLELRIVSPTNPGGRGRPAEPTLEDAYVLLMGGAGA